MATWYEKLQFDVNPLDTRPNPDLVGLDKEAEKVKTTEDAEFTEETATEKLKV